MPVKKILLFAVGAALVVGGITLTLKDWSYIQMVFRGVIGPLLAVIGMVVLVVAKD
jgi:intracellular septation protein A